MSQTDWLCYQLLTGPINERVNLCYWSFPQLCAETTSCPVTTISVSIGLCGVTDRDTVLTARTSGTVVRHTHTHTHTHHCVILLAQCSWSGSVLICCLCSVAVRSIGFCSDRLQDGGRVSGLCRRVEPRSERTDLQPAGTRVRLVTHTYTHTHTHTHPKSDSMTYSFVCFSAEFLPLSPW